MRFAMLKGANGKISFKELKKVLAFATLNFVGTGFYELEILDLLVF